MYTLIREADGSVSYRTRRPAQEMTRTEARRALSGLLPLLQELVDAAYPQGRPGTTGPDGTIIIPEEERDNPLASVLLEEERAREPRDRENV